MKIARVTLLLLFVALSSSNLFAQQLSNDELSEILGIKSWRIPMPKDESMEWSIEIVDYVQRKYRSLEYRAFECSEKSIDCT